VRLLNNQSARDAAKIANLSHASIVFASIVLQYALDLADPVLAGAISLDEAYATAKARHTPLLHTSTCHELYYQHNHSDHQKKVD
jgi:hypothetical protein